MKQLSQVTQRPGYQSYGHNVDIWFTHVHHLLIDTFGELERICSNCLWCDVHVVGEDSRIAKNLDLLARSILPAGHFFLHQSYQPHQIPTAHMGVMASEHFPQPQHSPHPVNFGLAQPPQQPAAPPVHQGGPVLFVSNTQQPMNPIPLRTPTMGGILPTPFQTWDSHHSHQNGEHLQGLHPVGGSLDETWLVVKPGFSFQEAPGAHTVTSD